MCGSLMTYCICRQGVAQCGQNLYANCPRFHADEARRKEATIHNNTFADLRAAYCRRPESEFTPELRLPSVRKKEDELRSDPASTRSRNACTSPLNSTASDWTSSSAPCW